MSNPLRIEIGDHVFVMYPGHPNPNRSFEAIVEHIPAATGDSWIFQDQTHGGVIYISEPVSISLRKKG